MRRDLRIVIGGVLAATLLLGAPALLAQSSVATGQVFGTVTDPDGAALPGCTVQARNPDTGFSRSAVSDASGFFRIDLLPPGSFELRADLTGFSSALQRAVEVTLGSSVRIDFAMQISAIEEEIVVTAEAPVVETTNPNMGASVGDQAIANLPLQGRDFLDFILLTPGAVVSDTDQVAGGRGGVNIGGRAIQNSFNIDGSNSQSTFFGEERGGTRPPFTFSQSAIKEFQVIKSSYNLQYSAGGGVVNAITKSGTNEFHGEVFGYYTDDSLTEEDALGRKAESEQLQYGFALGGPFVKDKLHFFTSLDTQDYTTPHFTDWDDFPAGREADWERLTGLDYDSEIANYPTTNDALVILLKLDWQLGEDHLATGRYNFSDQEGENLTSTFDDTGLSNNGFEENSFDSLVFTLNSVLSDDLFNEAFVQYANEERPRTENTTLVPETGIFSFRATWGQNNFLPNWLTEDRYQLVDNLTYYAGRHTLKAGINFDFVEFDDGFCRYCGGAYSYNNWTGATDGFLDGGKPFSYTQAFSDYDGQVVFNTDYYAAYLQDDWRANPKLTITYGARYDLQDHDQPMETNPLWPQTGQIPNDTNNWSLRAGLAWDIRGDGTQVLRGGLGRFYDRTPTLLDANAMLANGVRVIRVESRCLRGDPCPTYPNRWTSPGDLPEIVGDIFVYAYDFEDPETNRFSLGYERQLGRDFSVGVDVIYYETEKLERGQDQNIVPSGLATVDGRPRYRTRAVTTAFDQIIQFTSDARAEYTAVVLKAKKRFSNSWFLDASYTWSDAKDNNSNERSVSTSSDFPEDHYNLDGDWGPAAFDVEHRVVASFSYQLPLNLLVSAIGYYRSGYPYTATDGRDNNTDGYRSEHAVVQVEPGVYYHYPRNSERQPSAKNLDLRLSWTARLGGSLELELIGEIFNLTGEANWYVSSSNRQLVTSGGAINPNFGVEDNVGKARRYQLGAKLRF